MSENEGGDGGKMGAFLLGFLLGVLVCLGAGSAFVVVASHHRGLLAQEAMMEAEAARHEAEAARARAQKALEAAKKAKEKPKE